ncbi:MAG: hypothetical protein ACPL7B_03695 [Candidatus Poribacteria bacterium]
MRKVFIIIFSMTFLLLLINISFSAFDNADIGARPTGMGGAFIAIADDSNASSYNPAGLGFVKNIDASFTRLILYSGVANYNYAGVAVPLKTYGNIGMSFGILQEESKIYSEKNVAFSYSKSLVDKVSVGANIKMLSTGFDESAEWVKENPYFANKTTSGVTVDIGLLAKPISDLGIGLVAENLIPVDVSISESEEEKVPMSIKFGLAYKLSAIAKNAQQPALKEVLETTIISFEGGTRKEREVSATKLKAGIEMWFAEQTVGIRAGYNIKKVGQSSNSVNLGTSIKIPISNVIMRVDYAVQILGSDIQENLNHRISLAMSM